MIRGTKHGWAALTVVGLLAGAACADDQGIMRISDSPPPGSTAGPAAAAPGAPVSGQPAAAGTGGTEMPAGAVAAGGACEGGADAGRCRLCGCLQRIWAYNPAAGFRPPETAGIDRDAVIYYSYWPAKWYGQPGWRMAPSFPMVYMPTDTTQLGVYYARVPQWLPNPRMYPRPPRPDEWNRRVVRANHAGANCQVGMTAESGQPIPVGGPIPDSIGTPLPAGGSPQAVPQQPTMPPSPPQPGAPAPQGT